MSNDAEKDLAAFLAALPAYKRKELEQGFSSLTPDEQNQSIAALIADAPEHSPERWQEYVQLLQRVPAKLRDYRKLVNRENGKGFADAILPRIPAGAPRKDALAKEAIVLQHQGMNSPQIAAELNKRHGEGTTTPAAVPKLIKRFLARTKSSA